MKISVLSILAVAPAPGFAFVVPRAQIGQTVSSTSPTLLRAETEEKRGIFSDDVQKEAREVLEKVGWARPMEGDGEMTSEDPFVKQINEGIQRDFGVDLDDLLNPAKVSSRSYWYQMKG